MRNVVTVVGMFVMVGLLSGGFVALANESESVQVVKTYPTYGGTVPKLKGLVVEITFDRPMDPSTMNEVTMDQRGATNAAGEPIEFDGTYTWVNAHTLRFAPSGELAPDSVYQVTVWSATGEDGSELDPAPYRLPFSTAGAK